MRAHLLGRLAMALVLSAPAISSAQMTVESGHQAKLRVADDPHGYARVTATRPLEIQVAGPGELTMVLRQELEPDQTPGRTTTFVSLLVDGNRVESFRLDEASLAEFSPSSDSRPTAPIEHEIEVPADTKTYALRVDTPGHQIVASMGFVETDGDLDLMPIVPLAAEEEDDEDEELPLVALTGPQEEEEEESDEDLPLVGLVPPSSEDEEADVAETGTEVTLARLEDGEEPRPTTSPIVGAPIRDEPKTPRSIRMVLGVRGLAAATGMGGGTMGGGVDLLVDTGMLDNRLTLGLSTDVVAYSLLIQRYRPDGSIAQSTTSVQTIPVMAVASYILPFESGPVAWEVTGGVGPVIASVSDEKRSNRAVLAGGVLTAGPRIDAGPGSVSLGLRVTGSYGSIADGHGLGIVRGPFGGLGVSAGYVLSI